MPDKDKYNTNPTELLLQIQTEMREGFAAVRNDIKTLSEKIEVLNEEFLAIKAANRNHRLRIELLEQTTSSEAPTRPIGS